MKFDYELLAKLAKEDLVQFHRMRQRLLEDLVLIAPEHKRDKLRKLKWKIDALRETQAVSPFVTEHVWVSELMIDYIVILNEGLKLIGLSVGGFPRSKQLRKVPATVLQFKARNA